MALAQLPQLKPPRPVFFAHPRPAPVARGTGHGTMDFQQGYFIELFLCNYLEPYMDRDIYGYGSIPINTILRGMNIHLSAILMFTRGTRF